MLALHQTTAYALQALQCLKSGQCSHRQIEDIAACTGVPRAYLAKIFRRLSCAGLVQTKRGHQGGIQLSRPASQISLLAIVETLEGPDWLPDCLLGRRDCPATPPCPLHEVWQRTRRELDAALRQHSLADLHLNDGGARRKPAPRKTRAHASSRPASNL